METTFENAKVGDKVWDFVWGWGIIIYIEIGSNYPMGVSFPTNQLRYSYEGSNNLEGNDTLFWDKVKIEPPPRPKREVKKTGWVYSNQILSDPMGYFPKKDLVKVEYEIDE